MSKILCHYTIAKFIPDLIRDEPKNIGIILVNEKGREAYARFPEKSIRYKLGSEIWDQNRKIVKHYLEHLPKSKDELLTWVNQKGGTIQFSEIKSVVTEDAALEIEYLTKIFVNEAVEEKEIVHRFKQGLIKNLKKYDIVGKDKFSEDKEIEGGKSKISHKVDLSYQNGLLYVVEAIDLSKGNNKDTFETAFKFEDLKNGMREHVHTISAIKLPNSYGNELNHYLQILKATSDELVDLTNDQNGFIQKLKTIVN